MSDQDERLQSHLRERMNFLDEKGQLSHELERTKMALEESLIEKVRQLFYSLLRQPNIRYYRRFSGACVEMALSLCENHKRRITDVHSINIEMWENRKSLLEDHHFKVKQRTKIL